MSNHQAKRIVKITSSGNSNPTACMIRRTTVLWGETWRCSQISNQWLKSQFHKTATAEPVTAITLECATLWSDKKERPRLEQPIASASEVTRNNTLLRHPWREQRRGCLRWRCGSNCKWQSLFTQRLPGLNHAVWIEGNGGDTLIH